MDKTSLCLCYSPKYGLFSKYIDLDDKSENVLFREYYNKGFIPISDHYTCNYKEKYASCLNVTKPVRPLFITNSYFIMKGFNNFVFLVNI